MVGKQDRVMALVFTADIVNEKILSGNPSSFPLKSLCPELDHTTQNPVIGEKVKTFNGLRKLMILSRD